MEGINFQYPYFIIIFIAYIICIYLCKEKFKQILFPNLNILKNINKTYINLIKILKITLIILLTLTIMSPIKENKIIKNNAKGYEISILLDASGSMQENHKFQIVKSVLKEFIKKRKTDKLALTVFADFAYIAIPLTYDKKSILNLLDRMKVGIAGSRYTSLNEVLFLSTKIFKNSKSKKKIAILLTDGYDNTNTVPLETAIDLLKKENIKVYTIGIGSELDFDKNVLQKIANETGGEFYEANSKSKLNKIYNDINKLEKVKIDTTKYMKKTYYYQYLLILAILNLFALIILMRRK
jgi:Ca-activated chloride channel family protein